MRAIWLGFTAFDYTQKCFIEFCCEMGMASFTGFRARLREHGELDSCFGLLTWAVPISCRSSKVYGLEINEHILI
jgi:hypothetical protein